MSQARKKKLKLISLFSMCSLSKPKKKNRRLANQLHSTAHSFHVCSLTFALFGSLSLTCCYLGNKWKVVGAHEAINICQYLSSINYTTFTHHAKFSFYFFHMWTRHPPPLCVLRAKLFSKFEIAPA